MRKHAQCRENKHNIDMFCFFAQKADFQQVDVTISSCKNAENLSIHGQRGEVYTACYY